MTANACDEAGGHDGMDPNTSSLIIAKSTAMCTLFVAAALFGLVPFKLSEWLDWRIGEPAVDPDADPTQSNNVAAPPKSAAIVSALLAFGGGVLLATTFMHLLPEVAENVERLQRDGRLPPLQYHLAELLMCTGFFAMYFVEEMVHVYIHRRQFQRDMAIDAFERGQSVRNSILIVGRKPTNGRTNGGERIEMTDFSNYCSLQTVGQASEVVDNLSIVATIDLESTGESVATNKHYRRTTPITLVAKSKPAGRHGHNHIALSMHVNDDIFMTSVRGLLIVLALSIHELFEGLAVGLERKPGHVWYMFGAVAAHKLVLAFCVGVELISSRTRRWLAVVYVLSFAVVSPIGIGIGIWVSGSGGCGTAATDTQMASTILQGLACGTLLYVVFFEILEKNRSGLLQLGTVITGFLVMFGLQFFGKCVCVFVFGLWFKIFSFIWVFSVLFHVFCLFVLYRNVLIASSQLNAI